MNAQITLRVPPELFARLRALEAKVREDPDTFPYRVSLHSCARLALLRGLEALERSGATDD